MNPFPPPFVQVTQECMSESDMAAAFFGGTHKVDAPNSYGNASFSYEEQRNYSAYILFYDRIELSPTPIDRLSRCPASRVREERKALGKDGDVF